MLHADEADTKKVGHLSLLGHECHVKSAVNCGKQLKAGTETQKYVRLRALFH